MICPRCKSKNIAKNLYGNLGFDKRIKASKNVCKHHACQNCESIAKPKYYCYDCKCGFRTAPVLVSNHCVEAFSKIVTGIHYMVTVDIIPQTRVSFEKNNGQYLLYRSFDVQDREYYQERQDTELLLNITAKEWRNLLYELFTKLSIQDWKTQYDSFELRTKTFDRFGSRVQWLLEINLSDGRTLKYDGDEPSTPLFAKLDRLIETYASRFPILFDS